VEFWSICSINGLVLTEEQMALLNRYAEDLVYWNERVNLISRKDIHHIWDHHILHSIAPVLMGLMPDSGRILDIGTGGGLPGIPLKIVLPELDITLVDSIAKKVRTTSMLASHVAKHRLHVVRARAEELADDPKHVGVYDVVVARAVAPLKALTGWAFPLLKPDGKLIALKGGDLEAEIADAAKTFPDRTIACQDIELKGFDELRKEEKKIVVVT
jgi:16S rRNA (guanine527-N7)-methyltransferase